MGFRRQRGERLDGIRQLRCHGRKARELEPHDPRVMQQHGADQRPIALPGEDDLMHVFGRGLLVENQRDFVETATNGEFYRLSTGNCWQ